jgi:hypothetical protein
MNQFRIRLTAFFVASGVALSAQAQSACWIDFDDTFALSNFHDQARTHFALETKFGSSGALEVCGSDDWVGCWAYRDRCTSSNYYVNVWPWGTNNHLHMNFDDPNLQDVLCSCDPGDGYGPGRGFSSGSSCNSSSCPSWGSESRQGAYPHTWDDWVFIFVEEGGDRQLHVFDFEDMIVGGSNNVVIHWRFPNGDWAGGGTHAPGYHLFEVDGVNQVWVKGASSGPPGNIVDFIVIPQF